MLWRTPLVLIAHSHCCAPLVVNLCPLDTCPALLSAHCSWSHVHLCACTLLGRSPSHFAACCSSAFVFPSTCTCTFLGCTPNWQLIAPGPLTCAPCCAHGHTRTCTKFAMAPYLLLVPHLHPQPHTLLLTTPISLLLTLASCMLGGDSDGLADGVKQ